jgi:hypothetical protein
MTATIRTKPRRRRRARRRKRVGWFRGLRDQLAMVCLGVRHGRHAGYRVVRIVRAKVDRLRRQVVCLVVRMSDGVGFDGHWLTLDDRREFVATNGGHCVGLLRGRQTVSIDDFYRLAIERNRGGPGHAR